MFKNNTDITIILTTIKMVMDGLASEYDTEVPSGMKIILPESCTEEYHVYNKHYQRLGKFRVKGSFDLEQNGKFVYSWMYTDKYNILQTKDSKDNVFIIGSNTTTVI